MDKIFTANDRASELGFISYHAYLERVLNMTLPTTYSEDYPVNAVIDGGRWIAFCEYDGCKGTNYSAIDANEFFCPNCKNVMVGGLLRRVIFPDNIAAIEEELLKHEQKMKPGMFGTQGAADALGLPRMWHGESIEEIQARYAAYEQVDKDAIFNEYTQALRRVSELEAKIRGE